MVNKKLTLSIVIPVFNEEDYLFDCLDSIAAQTEMPDEVIVVDNNSTDESAEIARRYDFVKVIRESRQHQAFAQKTGFDEAKSDILGRIDADSVLPADWVANVKEAFGQNRRLVALKGTGEPYDVFGKRLSRAVFLFYNKIASKIAGCTMLWGANCAISKKAWRQIEDSVLLRADTWEDYELGFCLASVGEVRLVENIEIGTSFRAVHKSFLMQLRYQIRAVRTFYIRSTLLRTALFASVWWTMMVFYPFVLVDQYISKPLSRRVQKRTFTISEALESIAAR